MERNSLRKRREKERKTNNVDYNSHTLNGNKIINTPIIFSSFMLTFRERKIKEKIVCVRGKLTRFTIDLLSLLPSTASNAHGFSVFSVHISEYKIQTHTNIDIISISFFNHNNENFVIPNWIQSLFFLLYLFNGLIRKMIFIFFRCIGNALLLDTKYETKWSWNHDLG